MKVSFPQKLTFCGWGAGMHSGRLYSTPLLSSGRFPSESLSGLAWRLRWAMCVLSLGGNLPLGASWIGSFLQPCPPVCTPSPHNQGNPCPTRGVTGG